MDFNEYQRRALTTAEYPRKGNNINYPAMGLGSEAGEVLGKVKKIMRDDKEVITDKKRKQLKKELGDVQWYVAVTAWELGLTLDDIAVANLKKLARRKARNKIKGSGDDR